MKKVVQRTKEQVSRIKLAVNARKYLMFAYLMSVVGDLTTLKAYASGGTTTTAEKKWDTVIDFIVPWITRLGGVVILIGAVEFGLAFKNDDAEGKTKGMRTIIAGCIVTAVGASADVFLA